MCYEAPQLTFYGKVESITNTCVGGKGGNKMDTFDNNACIS